MGQPDPANKNGHGRDTPVAVNAHLRIETGYAVGISHTLVRAWPAVGISTRLLLWTAYCHIIPSWDIASFSVRIG
jgi:hypothetical protein